MSLPERPGSRQVRPPTAAAAAAVAFLVTACGQPPAAPPPVRIGVHGDPVSLDPHGQAELLSLAILGNVHEALTVLDREIASTTGARSRPRTSSRAWPAPAGSPAAASGATSWRSLPRAPSAPAPSRS